MKFLVFTYHDEMLHGTKSYKDVAELTMPSKIEYCNTHGYDFAYKDNDFDFSRKVNWERVPMFIDFIKKGGYDWLWFLGTDCMIMNHTIRLENIIDNNYDMILASSNHDKIEVNTDSWLVKCSDWSLNFLEKINKNISLYHHPWCEQQAVIDELHNPDVMKHFKIVSTRYFNSYYHAWFPDFNFQFGDFVIQAAGHNNDYRVKLFQELQHKIIKIPDYKIETELKI